MKTRPTESHPAGEASLADIYQAAWQVFPDAALGGGMLTLFTELNRNRPDPARIDFITHASTANVHAADDVSVLETLETLPHILRSAARIAGSRPYRLGPSGIGLRHSPYGPAVAENPDGRRIPMARRDPRHFGLFGAAWSLAFAEQCARHGLAEFSLCHGVGDFGVVGVQGALTPLYHVVRGLARGAGHPFNPVETGDPFIRGIGFGDALWLANLTAEPRTLMVDRPCRYAKLDAASVGRASNDTQFLDRLSNAADATIMLEPYAVARLVPQ